MEAVIYSGPNNAQEALIKAALENAGIVTNERRLVDWSSNYIEMIREQIINNILTNEIVVIVATEET